MFTRTVISCVLKTFLKHSESCLKHSDLESFLNICMVSAASIAQLAQCKNHQLFVTSLKDIEKALALRKAVDVLVKLSQEYHGFTALFFREKSDKLSSHCVYDHIISLTSEKEPPKGSLYNMSQDKLLILQKYLKEHLVKGFICVSFFSAASSVIFGKKPEGGLHLCVNYCSFNNLTVKNCYLLPLIWKTLNLITSSVIFIKLNIIAAFNKLQMAEEEK